MGTLISSPGVDPVDRDSDRGKNLEVNQGWRNFFTATFNLLSGLTQSGTTAQRPAKFLWTGRPYWNTDIGAVDYWNGVAWVSSAGPSSAVENWVKVGNALSYTTFQTAALFKTNTLFSLVAEGVISGIMIKPSVAFAGPGLVTVTLEVGNAGTTNLYASAFDVMQPVAGGTFGIYNVVGGESFTAATNILVTARSTGANLSVLTAGTVDIWALLSKVS